MVKRHTNQFVSRLARLIRKKYVAESSCHDLAHVFRVASIAAKLALHEGGNAEIILSASYLHDLHRMLEAQSGTRISIKYCDGITLEYLRTTGAPTTVQREVLEAIHYTDQYSFAAGGRSAASLEASIVRDADNLDAIGAIGIARAFVYGGHLGEPIWDPEAPFTSTPYSPGEKCPSIIHHFERKLLRLYKDFDLHTSRRLATQRTDVMRSFLGSFVKELEFADDRSAETIGRRIAE